MYYASMLSLFILIPVAIFLYQPRAEAQTLRDETDTLPEYIACYRRFFHAFAFVIVAIALILPLGVALIYASAYHAPGASMTWNDIGIEILGLLICGGGLYTLTLSVRDVVLYTKISPWGRPVIELSHSGLHAFGCIEVPWVKISQLRFFRQTDKRYGAGFYWWLVLDNESLSSANTHFKTATKINSSPLLARRIASEWEIPVDSFYPIPLYGTQLSQERLRIFIERYWSEATGHSYRPESIKLLYPQKTIEVSNKHGI